MTHHVERWQCDRCGKDSEHDRLDIFTLTPVCVSFPEEQQRARLASEFDLCVRCLEDILTNSGSSTWGRDFMEWPEGKRWPDEKK